MQTMRQRALVLRMWRGKMSIDLTTLTTNLQADVDAVDSSTSMSSILSLMHKARKITSISNYYDSAGLLPVDSSYDGMLAFSKADNTMYKFVDSGLNSGTVQGWHKADSASSPAAASPNQIGGDTKGYNLGTTTQSFPFASSTSGTSIMTQPNWNNGISQYEGAASHSTTHAYYGGGYNNPPGSASNTIQKFPFASEDNYSDVGDLTVSRIHVAGVSSTTHGYAAGGWPSGGNVIDKYAFASDGNATDVGDLTSPRFQNTGVQSTTHGYSYSGPSSGHHIEKWSFASDGNSTSAGNKLYNAYYTGDNSQSPTHVYRIGGYISDDTNTIEKSATASDGDGTDVGDITVARRALDNASSTDGYIYSTGGRNPSPTNIMERTSYSVDGNSVDVGDLASAASQSGGAHV